jgi:pSer/pThr/pTyr-binding forkhead associated (FHA) protein
MRTVTLRVLHGADRGRMFDRLPVPVTIGREEGNSIQLNDERISRYHLKLQEDNDKIVLTDLESTNGTRVNGEDIQVRIIRDGDMIAVGRSLLLFGSRSDIDRRIAEIAERVPALGGAGG